MPTRRRHLLGAAAALPLASLATKTMAQNQTRNAPAPSTPAHLSANPAGPFSSQPWDLHSRIDAGRYTVERVVFQSEGVDVVGNLFVPAANADAKKPGIVVTGPVAYVKEQAPIQYASRLAREGYVTLIYDPRYYGESAGMPRSFESRRAKVEDVQSAIAFLAGRAEVDKARVSVVGVCQGMNWAVEATANTPSVCAVALVAGHYLLPEVAAMYLGNLDNVAARIAKANESRASFERTGEVNYIPIVSLTDSNALLAPRAIHDFYYRWADRGPFSAHTGLWENRITQMSEADIWGGRIDLQLKRLIAPALMVHSERAASGAVIPRQMFEQIASKDKQAVWLAGRNQIQFYQDPLTIDMVVPYLTDFLRKHSA